MGMPFQEVGYDIACAQHTRVHLYLPAKTLYQLHYRGLAEPLKTTVTL